MIIRCVAGGGGLWQPGSLRVLMAGWAAGVIGLTACCGSWAQPSPRASSELRTSSTASAAKRSAAHRAPRPPALTTDSTPLYGDRPDVVAYGQQMASEHGWDPQWVLSQLSGARRLRDVQQLMMPPPAGTAKNWGAYRARFLTPDRIAAGAQFWHTHATWLEKAEQHWGVPAWLVVGIVGVETFYGRILGRFRVLDALATLSFDFPSGRSDRSGFFREELQALLMLAHLERQDASSWRGSYAGAMGLPQFMPSSILRFAVDFDEDGHIDLYGSAADVIGSVAHFLAAAGWERDLPTHFAVAAPVETDKRAYLLGPDILPTFTASEFMQRGAVLESAAQSHPGLLALVELQMGEAAPVFVAGTQNFWVVTRYNRSSYYAMAVIDLGQAVNAARQTPSAASQTLAASRGVASSAAQPRGGSRPRAR